MPPAIRKKLTPAEAKKLALRAGAVFTPQTPVSTQKLFAGRLDKLERIVDAVFQVGLHIVVYGERGVGKTSIANIIAPLLLAIEANEDASTESQRIVVKVNADSKDTFATLWAKALDEIQWTRDTPRVGFTPSTKPGEQITLREALGIGTDGLTTDTVRKALSVLKGSVFVFDEFDRLQGRWATSFTDLIKALSDNATDTTVVLVGVGDTVNALVKDHASITRALTQIHMPRMTRDELLEIITKAQDKLGVRFGSDGSDWIAKISQGLPHYVHLLGLEAVREACKVYTCAISQSHVHAGCNNALSSMNQTLTKTYDDAKHSSHKALYEQVLIACALAASNSTEQDGIFQASDVVTPLGTVLKRGVVHATFSNHLSEFADSDRGSLLQRFGKKHAYKYRFVNPLFVPYVLMRGISAGLIAPDSIQGISR